MEKKEESDEREDTRMRRSNMKHDQICNMIGAEPQNCSSCDRPLEAVHGRHTNKGLGLSG